MSNFDVVSIGSAVLDVLLLSSQFTSHAVAGELMICEVSGGKIDVEEATLTSGGAGTNTAVAFSRQGLKASVVAEIGKDVAAQIIIDELRKEKVDTSLLVEEQEEKTGMSAVMVSTDGSRSAMTFRGAAKQLSHKDVPFSELSNVSHIHLSSIGNVDLIREIMLFCKQQHINLSWNPSATELKEVVFLASESLQASLDTVFMNDLEFEQIREQFGKLEKMASIIIVTKGKVGGEVFIGDKKTVFSAKKVVAVSELGAGDAFASGFVGARIKNRSIEDSINWGIENAASVVQQLGAKKGLLSFSSK